LIVCDVSKVDVVDDGWKIGISQKIVGALGLFEGQTLFGSLIGDSSQMMLSTLRLTPTTHHFRIYLEDVRGSLARITEIFADSGTNILSGGAFSMGNLWLSEFIVDFKGSKASVDEIVSKIEDLGGFVTSREITELFPRSFDLQSTFKLTEVDDKLQIVVTRKYLSSVGQKAEPYSYAVLSAWPRVKALFLNFYGREAKLLRIKAIIGDVPGSLHALAEALKTQVDLQAIDELHHDAASGEWLAFGVLVVGDLERLTKKALELPNVIKFEAEPMGWSE